jgi:hypothetical protein
MDNSLQLDICFIKQHRLNLVLMIKKVRAQPIDKLTSEINGADDTSAGILQG